ncbi:MAG TPA: ATP-binding protein [Anaeromyxobacteraceae bacterium]
MKVKLLVVDDRAENRLALEALLRRPDYEIVSVSSGAEALRFLLRGDCAAILMDVQMPDMDGFETTRLIRENERTRSIPVVFMTADRGDEKFVARGYQAGAIDYLVKPVEPEILRAKIAGLAEIYRANREAVEHGERAREQERGQRVRAIAELERRSRQREKAAHERYQRLVEGIRHAILWIVDPTTLACTFVSPSAESILGFPRESWLETPAFWRDRLPPEDRRRFVDAVASIRVGRESVLVEHALVKADGAVARFRTDLALVLDADAALGVRAFSVDVSELKAAEDALLFLDRAGAELARSLDLESTLSTAARAAVPALAESCVLKLWPRADEDTPLVASAGVGGETDEAMRRLAGHPALDELRAQPGTRVLQDVPEDGSGAPGALPGSILATSIRARDRALGALCLYGAAGRRYGPREILLAEEFARRCAQAFENALLYRGAQQAVRLRDDFLSIASHELRTPLTPLTLQVQSLGKMASEQLEPGPARDRLLSSIRSCSRQTSRISRLVANLLEVTRLRSGRMNLELEEFDLNDLVVEVAGRFEEELVRAGRSLAVVTDGAVVGRWDRFRLDQVVTNLLANAVKYGAERPVELSMKATAEEAVLRVSDSGIGIPEDEIPRIFDRFERGSATRSFGGLGLGLYISRQITEAHGGAIGVASTVGRGSTFTVTLPLTSHQGGDARPG